jgi:hypothetical protein
LRNSLSVSVEKAGIIGSPTACASAAWPAVQNQVHYTDSVAEEHTNEDSGRRPGQLQARVGRLFTWLYIFSFKINIYTSVIIMLS